ncbi:MAG: Maf family protein [Filifactor alocis]|nr:Maf family protein [Filifactor alocis]
MSIAFEKKIILASNSPRRKSLLEEHKIAFDIITEPLEEDISYTLSPESTCMSLAFQKGIRVARAHQGRTVLSADTIVSCNNVILGKPKDRQEAFEMLSFLSGKTQLVLTGFSLIHLDRNIKILDYSKSEIVFKQLSKERIEAYIQTGDYRDKAGSYGIQSGAFDFVESIKGDFNNVVGLPIDSILTYLDKI